MSGYMIAEVWCEDCSDRIAADDEGTLRDHRANLREAGWRRVRRDGLLVDLCSDCAVKATHSGRDGS